METIEKGVKYFKVSNTKNKTTSTSMFLLLTLKIFHTFSTVSIVNFEQVNVSWDVVKSL